MPPLRFLLIALAVAALVILVRRLFASSSPGPSKRPPPQLEEDMVRCARCGVHVPKSEAVPFKDQWFCSDRHLQEHRDA